MKQRITRRALLGSAAAASAGILILDHSRSAWSFAANEKINTAHIGCGGRGRELLFAFSQQAHPVAFCDVNENKATEMYRKFPEIPKFQDFRKMLDQMSGQIDAVVVATPDHTHAIASAAAIRAGKHVYTEKPLTRTVYESRFLRALAKEHKVATSMGNQGTAAGPFRRALELIQDNVLGQITGVYVWNDQGGAGRKEAPTGEEKIPPYLKWDLWLGPAAARPFNVRWLGWGQWRDFGTSQLGNWASHTANLAFRAMKVDSLWYADPVTKPILRIQADVEEVNRLSFPRWEQIRWDIPARGNLPPISFHWFNGSRGPGVREKLSELLGHKIRWGENNDWADWAGCLIVGTEGKIYSSGHNATFTMMPAEKFKGVKQDAPEHVDRSQGHERDWLLACAGGKPAWANYDYAGPLNEFLQLGNVATQFEGALEYDPLAGKIINNTSANAALRSEYREGWTL